MNERISKPIARWELIPFRSVDPSTGLPARAKESYGLIDPKKVRQIEERKLMSKGS